MRLRTPVTGAVIVVADDKAEKYIGKGFQPIEEPQKQVKKTAKKSKEQ